MNPECELVFAFQKFLVYHTAFIYLYVFARETVMNGIVSMSLCHSSCQASSVKKKKTVMEYTFNGLKSIKTLVILGLSKAGYTNKICPFPPKSVFERVQTQ